MRPALLRLLLISLLGVLAGIMWGLLGLTLFEDVKQTLIMLVIATCYVVGGMLWTKVWEKP